MPTLRRPTIGKTGLGTGTSDVSRQPLGLPAAARFVAAATLSLAGAGVLVRAGLLPWVETGREAGLLELYESLGPRARAAFAAWQATGLLVAAVLPSLALLAWGRRFVDVRRALVPYVLVLLAQVAAEALLAQVFFPNLVVLTGVLFTSYRLRQLWRSRLLISASRYTDRHQQRALRVLLTAGLAFWAANLAFLLTVALPSILRTP